MPPSSAPEPAPVLAVDDLGLVLAGAGGEVPVVEHLSFSVAAGQTVALVGESGCGKSITALAIMGLLPDGFRRASGSVRLEGEDVATASPARLRALRGNRMSMIFQDPMSALNPLYTIGDQIGEALRLHQRLRRREAVERALAMLKAVRIPAAETRLAAYPHELSGGMRQRVMIAMALACRPRLLIADEPTTALDVTVQAEIFDLLAALQAETRTAIVLITHDLGAVADIADHVAVLYAGRCVEQGTASTIMRAPRHPYTRGLMACVPTLRLGRAAGLDSTAGLDGATEPGGAKGLGEAARGGPLPEIGGMVPPLAARPATCAFAARCPRVDETCRSWPQPALAGEGLSRVACFHPGRAA